MIIKEKKKILEKELATLLNRLGIDSLMNIPDFVLSEYLVDSLNSYLNIQEQVQFLQGLDGEDHINK